MRSVSTILTEYRQVRDVSNSIEEAEDGIIHLLSQLPQNSDCEFETSVSHLARFYLKTINLLWENPGCEPA